MQMMDQMMGNDPHYKRAMQMAQGKSPEELEVTVKNLCTQCGVNFEEFKQFFSHSGFR